MTEWLKTGERIDDLQIDGLHIIQHPDRYCFSMDAVLLTDFAAVRPGDTVVDLGTGSAILPLLLCARTERTIFHAFEIQPDMADMASRSVRMNSLAERIKVYEMDVSRAPDVLGFGQADYVITNPPYSRCGSSVLNRSAYKHIARHECEGGLKDFMLSASSLLRTRGRLAIVFPASRMLEIIDEMRGTYIEPKRIRLVYPKADRAPNLVLLEGVKRGRPGLHFNPPLLVYSQDGTQTAEMKRIYHVQ
jgi:tRNA1Val (adenine37-N6)-methyltransferase